VETAEAYRGRGYARKATAVWASALRRDGMLPLYSTSWDNIASQRVAASLGAVRYATNFNIR
jgi:RimJ/RimL family protein N-acetyltransferase